METDGCKIGKKSTIRKRILLLGTTGLLGSCMAAVLSTRFPTYSPKPRIAQGVYIPGEIHWLSSNFEASNLETFKGVLEEANPDFIVNCVAITLDSPLAKDGIANIIINSLFPHQLASLAYSQNIHLIHFSTDGVFSGRKGNYTETDIPDPPDLYGRSKLLGEVTSENCLTIRTSFFGLDPRGKGLVGWLLQQQGGSIKGFNRSIFSGLSTFTLARLVADVIAREIPLTGLYHVGGYPISKYELLVHLAQALRVDVTIEPVDFPVLDRSLDSSRFWGEMQLPEPTLKDMVDDLKQQLEQSFNKTRRLMNDRKQLRDPSDEKESRSSKTGQ